MENRSNPFTILSRSIVLLASAFACLPTSAIAQQVGSDNDGWIIGRMKVCSLIDVAGDDFKATFTVTGTVLDSDEQPVAGAVVVLRESSTQRISSQPDVYLYREDRHLARTDDVFARVTTDEQGRFEIRDAKAPPLPKQWSNSWRGSVVAAHPKLGVGWVSLGEKREVQRIEPDLTIKLRPTEEIAGRFVDPDGKPVAGAVVNLHRLLPPGDDFPGSASQLDVAQSQIAPRVTTDSEGRFRFHGLPSGMIASISFHHEDWFGGSGFIATSDDVPTGKGSTRNSYLRGESVLASGSEFVADPAVEIHGRVVDENGVPAQEVSVTLSPTIFRDVTDESGEFRFRASRAHLRNANSAMSLSMIAPPESGLLSDVQQLDVRRVFRGEPIVVELQRGVQVSGRVVNDQQQPIEGARIHVWLNYKLGAQTDENGNFRIALPRGKQVIVVSHDEPGYKAPSRIDVYRSKNRKSLSAWPHVSVNVSTGTDQSLPPITVSAIRPLQVIASLPSGEPAKGATTMIRDERPRRPPRANFPMPAFLEDRSEPVMTNSIGRADLLPTGPLSEKAIVEIKLSTEEAAYFAKVNVSDAVDGVLAVTMKAAWSVRGRVLIDGVPAAGASVSIGQSTPHRRTGTGIRSMGSTVSNHITAITDQEGWYRAAVAPDHQYSVSMRSLPDGVSVSTGVGYRASHNGDGQMTVQDFRFIRGDEEISGRVIDAAGDPIARARVQIMRESGVSPGFWIGHREASRMETDALGQFWLRKMPQGEYRLLISGPRDVDNARPPSTIVSVTTEDDELTVTLQANPQPELPRLEPKRIEKIQ